jgi:site-specific DNA-cytosine methylase
MASGQSVSRSTTYIENRGLYRKLTPLECERLQTLPDNATLLLEEMKTGKYKGQIHQVVSDTQRYKMIGNGWTIEVIKHIFSNLPELYTE